MTFEIAFAAINIAVLPAWMLLVFLPNATFTHKFVHTGIFPLLLGLFYIITFVMSFAFEMGSQKGNFFTLPGISSVFSHPLGVLIGWSHYLVFDLFVGAWEARDSRRRGLNHLAVVPCLLLTFILGPVGLVAYVMLRLATGTGFSFEEID